MEDFRRKILKLNGPRVHKISGSFGVYDSLKHIRKNKWKEIGHPVDSHDFYSVVRTVNKHLAELLSYGNDVQLPYQMGRLEIRKYEAHIDIKDGKVVTNLPVDWNRTLKLWQEDEESYQKRTLVKVQEKEIFKIYYNRGKATYINKSYFDLKPNRELKRTLKKHIKEGLIDAYNLK